MRIIAGSLGGRTFDSPSSPKTHPMSDKIRGAMFGVLGDIEGLSALDAFSGSGALSFEAISRGVAHVTAIELDKDAYHTITSNAQQLGVENLLTVLRKNTAAWTRRNQDKTYDLVLADPPYDDIRPDILQRLSQQTKPNGLFVLSWPGSEPVRDFAGVTQVSTKKYGDAQLVFYRKIQ